MSSELISLLTLGRRGALSSFFLVLLGIPAWGRSHLCGCNEGQHFHLQAPAPNVQAIFLSFILSIFWPTLSQKVKQVAGLCQAGSSCPSSWRLAGCPGEYSSALCCEACTWQSSTSQKNQSSYPGCLWLQPSFPHIYLKKKKKKFSLPSTWRDVIFVYFV